MIGGMVSAPLLSLFVVPAAYGLMRRRDARAAADSTPLSGDTT
jgi:Cu(I)/Ag(I) efflux system membrane protein CusA/SilA